MHTYTHVGLIFYLCAVPERWKSVYIRPPHNEGALYVFNLDVPVYYVAVQKCKLDLYMFALVNSKLVSQM